MFGHIEFKPEKAVGVCVALVCFLSISTVDTLVTFEQAQTILRTVPQEMTLGSPALEDITDIEFTIAVVVENVKDLQLFDVQFGWNTTYLEYTSYIVTVTIEDYPNPVPPSPYPGILHSPTMKVREVVDESGIPCAEPRTMAWFAYCQRAIAPPFYGSGTVLTMSFRVKHQPYIYELPADADHVNLPLCFTWTDLADEKARPISHVVKDGIIKLYARIPSPDINNDGIVNVYDVVMVATAYGSRVGDTD